MSLETEASYYGRRAQMEWAAAAAAGSTEAQQAHLQLAELYLQLAEGSSQHCQAVGNEVEVPRIIILNGE